MKISRRRALGLTLACSANCSLYTDHNAPARIAGLREEQARLHQQFESAAAHEPLAVSASSDPGGVILAVRSDLIRELSREVAARYLDHVTLDLGAVKAHGSGQLDKDTFLGRHKLGSWDVRVELGEMVAVLRARPPGVSLRPPDLIDIDLPVDIEESVGDATLHFEWDSAGVANAVCRDFQSTIAIRGRVLPQRHVLSGALQLRNTGERLTETPRFPDRNIQLRMDLVAASWIAVERALRAENTFGKCGMFMHPADVLAFLRGLTVKGLSVRLPDSIFRAVDLPASFQPSVQVNQRPIGLGVAAESLRIDATTLWSSVSVRVQAGVVGPRSPR